MTCSDYGFTGQLDLSCSKRIHIGAVRTGQCDDGEEMDVGLCYPKCRSGFSGVGPVCWGQSPIVNGKRFVNCGMGAAKDDGACAAALAAQISSPFMMIANVVTLGATSQLTKTTKFGQLSQKVLDAAEKVTGPIKKTLSSVADGMADGIKKEFHGQSRKL